MYVTFLFVNYTSLKRLSAVCLHIFIMLFFMYAEIAKQFADIYSMSAVPPSPHWTLYQSGTTSALVNTTNLGRLVLVSQVAQRGGFS